MRCCRSALLSGAALLLPMAIAGQSTPYDPPSGAQPLLGKLTGVLRHSAPVDVGKFPEHPAKFITVLPGGQLYFEVKDMDVDDDGSRAGSPPDWTPNPVRTHRSGSQFVDHVHQDSTSYGGLLPRRKPGPDGTDAISPFETPYIVVPTAWFHSRGIAAGDGAVVLRGNQLEYAVVGDFGPDKIGEMSVKLHELFGSKVLVDGLKARLDASGKPIPGSKPGTLLTDPAKVTRNSGTPGPFVVVVFPKTSVKRAFQSVDASLKPLLQKDWRDLTGVDAP